MSIRKYAEHRGVTHPAVIAAIKAGRIPREKNGKIDSAKADRAWNENTDQSKPKNSVTGDPKMKRGKNKPPKASPALEAKKNGNGAPTYSDNRTKRELFLALKAELDYQEATRQLVKAEDVRLATFAANRAVRDKLLGIPDHVAGILAATSDEAEIRLILDRFLREVCEEIAREGLGQAGDP